MEKILKIGLLVSLIIYGNYLFQINSKSNKQTESEIFKNYSDIVCEIFVESEVIGKNFFKETKNTKDYSVGSCFLAEFNGKIQIMTVAHIARDKDENILKKINYNIFKSSQMTDLRDVWKEIAEIKIKRAVVVFQIPGFKHSLANAPEDFDFASTDTPKNKIILEANLIKFNHDFDLAALELKDKRWYKILKAGEFGDSNQLEINQPVQVIGRSMGHSFTGMTGKISHFHIEKKEKGRKEIYTSAEIGFGNSGSPLLNDKGEVVGICVKLIPMPHFSIFIPSNTIKEFLNSK